MSNKEKKYTWRQLKEAVNSIDDEHLDKEVIWWGDERGGNVTKLDQLEEDYLDSDYGYEPESTYDNEEDKEDARDRGCMIKGTPILLVD